MEPVTLNQFIEALTKLAQTNGNGYKAVTAIGACHWGQDGMTWPYGIHLNNLETHDSTIYHIPAYQKDMPNFMKED